jgi:DNA-binding winged helix-turn-helix (wHTH) protein/tetratricopeptide (TPR) repeat protein
MKLFPPFRLDTVNECIWRSSAAGADERILLTPKGFEVLRYLVEHAGRLVTHRELLDSVWAGAFIEPQAVKKQIFDLRRVLDDPPRTPRFIETVARRGYRFIAPVEDSAPRPPAASPPPLIHPLVGRDGELAELRRGLRKALAGERQIVFITGEPGIGKTALAEEFQRQTAARDSSVRIARGQCVEGFGSKEPFYPMLEALGELCRGDEGATVLEILAKEAPTWLVQFAGLLRRDQRESLQREVLGATPERMLREVVTALETIASLRPLLLVFEDLHWVDYSTVDLISAVARHRTPAKLMLVATYRPLDVALSDHPLGVLKPNLLARQFCHEIAIPPLSVPQVVQYLGADASAAEAPTGLAALVHRHTEGNPLFMVGVLEHLSGQGFIQRTERAWELRCPLSSLDLEIPESLRQVIETQVQALSPDDQRVLEVASIAGVIFTPVVTAATGNLDSENFEGRCETLARRRQLLRVADTEAIPGGNIAQRYEFQHALYREVLYRRQAPAHRATLHRHLGARLVTLYGQSSEVGTPAEGRSIAQELAHHFEQGGDWPQAVKYLRLAAQVAARRTANREATANLEHALELATKLPESERPAVETEILEQLAGIYRESFDEVRAVETYEALRARAAHYGLIDVEIRALIDMAFPLSWSSTDRYLEVLDRALRLSSRQQDPLARARTYASCLVRRIWAGGWNEEDADQCRKALVDIRRSAGPAVVALHLLDYSLLQWFSSNYREAHRVAIESLARFTEDCEDDLYLSFPYWLSRFIVPRSLFFLGDWGAALSEIDAAITLAEKNGNSSRAMPLYLGRAWFQLFGMDYAKARDICLSVLPLLGNPGWSPWRRSGWIIAGTAEVGLGNHERALEHLLAAKQEMDSHTVVNDWYSRMMLQAALADLWLARGDLRQAKREGEVFVTVACATAERTWQALAWEVNARIAIAVSEPERAQDCITKALSAMDGFEVPLAEWRAHATAAELSELRGHGGAANHHRELSRATVLRLAHSLPEDHPLRITFLSTPPISTIVAGAGLVQGSR